METIETFKELGYWRKRELMQDEPSCINGKVRVKKYRIVIEEIEEPIEVIRGRIQKLWDTNDNWHHNEPLKEAGKKYGLILE